MIKKLSLFALLLPSVLHAEPNILAGVQFYDQHWKEVVYRVTSFNGSASQIEGGLPVGELDKQIDENAISRRVRYKWLRIDGMRLSLYTYCVKTEEGITCADKDGNKLQWLKNPTYKQHDIREWYRKTYAKEACFAQLKKNECQTFY